MATVGNLYVNVHARTTGMMRGLARARAAINRFGANIAAMAAKAVVAVAAVAFAIGVMMVKKTFALIDATAKLADRLGALPTEIMRLQHAAKIMGISIESLNKSLQQFQRRIGDARRGIGLYHDTLIQLGLDAKAISELGMEEAFLKVVDAIKKLPTVAARANAAYQMFGRTGIEMLNMIELGSGAIREMGNEFERLGGAISRIDAAKIEEANDAITRMGVSAQGVANIAAIEVAPAIEGMAQATARWVADGGMFFIENAIRAVGRTIAKLVNAFQALVLVSKLSAFIIIGGWSMVLQTIRAVIAAMVALAGIIPGLSIVDRLGAAALNTIDTALEKMTDRTNEAAQSLRDSLMSDDFWATQRIETFFNQMDRESKNAEANAAGLKRKIEAQGDAFTEADVPALKYLATLQQQADTFGMTSREVELYKHAMAGATQEVLDAIAALDEQLTAMERQQDLMREGERVTEEMRNPLEKFNARMEQLNDLLKAGAINEETFRRAAKKAREEMEKAAGVDIAQATGPRAITTSVSTALGAAKIAFGDPSERHRKSVLDNDKKKLEYLSSIADNTKSTAGAALT